MNDVQTHTPGPWRLGGDFTDYPQDGYIVGENGRGRVVAQVDRNDEADAANARLIAAAPDLLDAAQLALQLCEEAGLDNTVHRSLNIIRMAIAQATGR